MKPALTAEEWADPWLALTNEGIHWVAPDYPAEGLVGLDGEFDRHALAALCLHDQPFGFTREDMDALRSALEQIELDPYCFGAEVAILPGIIDRIEALLPPEDI